LKEDAVKAAACRDLRLYLSGLKESAMPHVIVKLWPGKSEAQKSRLAERIAQAVMDILNYGDESVSVAFEEISAKEWKDKVYKPDILSQPEKLYKSPGYTM
jgi:4-oxalocrotonate tautomerase